MLTVAALPSGAHAAKSHLLQKPEGHVLLRSISSPGAADCSRFMDRILVEVAPDGTVAADEFVVPDRSVLVVTDLDWTVVESPTGFVASRTLSFGLEAGGTQVFFTGRVTGADLAVGGLWTDSASLTTGIRVGPGTRICPTASSQATGAFAAHSVVGLILRGYLIKSK